MGFFNFGKKKPTRQPDSTPQPEKEPAPAAKERLESKWNDIDYLRKLDAALKANPHKAVVQVITDTDQDHLGKTEKQNGKEGEYNRPAPFVSVKITTQRVEKPSAGEISRFPFSPLCEGRGKFLNYRKYQVIGIGKRGRKKTMLYCCRDEQQAAEKAIRDEIMAPLDIKVIEPEPPTERQLTYAKDLGIVISAADMENITKEDISCMISRAIGDDSAESPTPALMAMALEQNWQGSAYIGHKRLWHYIVKTADDKTLAALYIYAVQQYQNRQLIGNMYIEDKLELFYQFAEYAIADPSVLKSIKGREPDDFIEPSKNTIAYKAAAEFLHGTTK